MPSIGHEASSSVLLVEDDNCDDLMNKPPEQHQRPLSELHFGSKAEKLEQRTTRRSWLMPSTGHEASSSVFSC
jgi:hypothetical protein